MKTTVKLIATAIIASLLGACSSSMQLNKSSSHQGDDLYYSSKSSGSTETKSQDQTSSSLKLAELEKKYTEILANDSIGSIDTTIYNDTYVNPYDRILANTYEEAYQRRLDARMDPYYGMSNWTARYSNDYWYASAYDPYFYNVVVVGSSIWVEPNYISSGFGWPYFGSRYYRPYYSFGLGFHSPSYGWYSPWNYPIYNHWSYGGYNPWSTYSVYNAGYYDGYNWGNNSNYNYGRRPGTGTVNYDRVVAGSESVTAGVNSTRRDMASKQATFGAETARDRVSSSKNQGSAAITQPGEIVGDLRSDNRRVVKPGTINGTALGTPQDPETKTRIAGDRQGKTTRVAEPVRDKNNNIVSRPSRESANANLTRISTRSSSRSGDRTHTPTYTRPNPGNNTKFNTPSSRNYPASQGVSNSNRAGQNVGGAVRSPRQPSPSYTPPPRSSSPAINRGSSNTRGSSISRSRGSSSVGSSRSTGSSSVGSSSSGSSSKGTSSTGSSSTSTRSR